MASEELRKPLKRSGKSVHEIHVAAKDVLFLEQRSQRERLITKKRLKVESLDQAGSKLSAEKEQEQVVEATKLLKSSQKVEALTTLHRCFARDPKNAETFIKHEGLPLLQSCLLSSNSSQLNAAAWCAINLTASDSHAVKKAIRLSPFLIQFLQGSDSIMQELCAWAIGNLAGDSQSNKETLLNQGVIPHLMKLMSSSHHVMMEARTQSVLHALINLAQDTTYKCCRSMLERSLFSYLTLMFKEVPDSSQFCPEIGWLTACVYSRAEILTEICFVDQCVYILHLVVGKLMALSILPDSEWKVKAMLPYLICCGNIIGLSPELGRSACDLPSFLPAMNSCLSSTSHSILMNTIWTLTNLTVDPSCRTMLICQGDLIPKLLTLCRNSTVDVEIVIEVLSILEGLVRVSYVMNNLLVKQGFLANLSQLLRHAISTVAEKVIGILEVFLQDTETSIHATAAIECVSENLFYFTTISFDFELVERAKALVKIISLGTSSS